MGGLQPWHIILIVVVALLLFGGKKLPDAARGVGRSLRILKSEVSAMHDDEKKKPASPSETDATAAVATPVQQLAPTPAATPVVVPVTPVVTHTPVAVQPPVAAVPPVTPAVRTTINGVPVDQSLAS